jgi:uncharacterized integral membrane protein (TIGR00697 family)
VNVDSSPKEKWLPAIASLFVTSLIVANIIAVKLFSAGPFVLPAGIIIFPISYIFGDVLTEVYGYARARSVIWIGFACNLFAVAVIAMSIVLSPSSIWRAGDFQTTAASQEAFAAILGFAPRLLAASFVAYLVGEFLNSFVMAKMKIATKGKHLWSRTIGSTLAGQFADSLIFIALAFTGTVPAAMLVGIILSQWLVKSVYETVATPLTYWVVIFLKKSERQDHYDYGTDFNPLKMRKE